MSWCPVTPLITKSDRLYLWFPNCRQIHCYIHSEFRIEMSSQATCPAFLVSPPLLTNLSCWPIITQGKCDCKEFPTHQPSPYGKSATFLSGTRKVLGNWLLVGYRTSLVVAQWLCGGLHVSIIHKENKEGLRIIFRSLLQCRRALWGQSLALNKQFDMMPTYKKVSPDSAVPCWAVFIFVFLSF